MQFLHILLTCNFTPSGNVTEFVTIPTCPFCQKAKDKLKDNYLDFTEYDISHNEEELRRKLAEMFEIPSGRATVPQIAINGKYIGGYSELKELINSGKLNQYLK